MGYTNLEDMRAGRASKIQAEVAAGRESEANRIVIDRDNAVQERDAMTQRLSAERERGIELGSRAGKADATRFFAEQGFIPGQFAQAAQMEMDQAGQQDDLEFAGGLGIQQDSQDGAVEAQADDISTKLLQASMQGAPDEVVNQTLDQLNAPTQVKQAAAQMFLQKRQDVGSQGGGMDQGPQDLLAQFKAKPTENTQRAFGIMAETDQRMAELHQKLNPQPQGEPQNG